MDRKSDKSLEDAPWRLISIKAQSVPYEIPMYVILAFRASPQSQAIQRGRIRF